MKERINIPVSLCEYTCSQDKFQALSALIFLHFKSSGIISIKEARNALKLVQGLSSNPSRKKVLDELLQLNWIGYNPKTRYVHLRSFRRICFELNLGVAKVIPCSQKDLANTRYFIYAVVINAKLYQQKSAIKLQTGRDPVANKSEATLQGPYPGLGKFGLGLLLHCSPTTALRIKAKCLELGFIRVHKKSIKIMTLPKADFNLSPYLKDIYVNKSFLLKFRKNYQTGLIEVYEQLKDEMVPLLKIKKRGKNRFEGIKGLKLAASSLGVR